MGVLKIVSKIITDFIDRKLSEIIPEYNEKMFVITAVGERRLTAITFREYEQKMRR